MLLEVRIMVTLGGGEGPSPSLPSCHYFVLALVARTHARWFCFLLVPGKRDWKILGTPDVLVLDPVLGT